MTRLYSCAAQGADTLGVIEVLREQFPPHADAIRMVFAFYGCGHDDHLLHYALRQSFPAATLLGGTSSGGVASERGFGGPLSIGLLLIEDEDGDYGAASARLGDDPAAAAQDALCRALASCGCAGQLPELIWIYQAPGSEEAVIKGLCSVIGDGCPIIGGTSADENVLGFWRQLGPEGVFDNGLVVGVLFPSTPLGFSFQGGYEPLGPNGIVTGIGRMLAGESGIVTAMAGREIVSIDNEPAAVVYNRWTGGLIDRQVAEGGVVLAETTMRPIAVEAGRIEDVAHYLLVHPESVSPGGGLRTFCNLEVGSRVYAMHGDRGRLIRRAGRVVEEARRGLENPRAVAGALVVYCAGCKIAVGEEIGSVADTVAHSLGEAPFVTCFTFGEQGRLIDHNVHGNLMISAVVFGS
ncbi:MAG: FIST C-terminal domain-containing protein [Betaproteobacteria bacterium]|nr:FIST C-terminal domain-containing protein [Betaproteobacteria bacterium]MCL2885931.1 FIST C-terminal domain-containing protein [Betaproteobacteria bacterium]